MLELSQVIYKNSNELLVVLGAEGKDVRNYIPNLSEPRKLVMEGMKVLCDSYLKAGEVLEYVVYKVNVEILYIQPKDSKQIPVPLESMGVEERDIVEGVGIVCTEILNGQNT